MNMVLFVLLSRLLLAFAVGTGFLSMWISNTASTAMMIPIARAVLYRLLKIRNKTTAADHSATGVYEDQIFVKRIYLFI